jgi:hypothetical protein
VGNIAQNHAATIGQRALVRQIPSKAIQRMLMIAIDPTYCLRLMGIQKEVLQAIAIILAILL